MPNIFGWLGNRDQRQVYGQIQEHTAKVAAVVALLGEALDLWARGDLEGVKARHARLAALEHEADEMRRDLLERLSRGLFLPPDRADLVQLAERVDDIADYAHASSRILVLFSGPPPAELREDLVRFGGLLAKAVGHLAEACQYLQHGTAGDALAACTRVETVEEEADLLKADLLRVLFSLDLKASPLLLLHEVISAMENTADRAEDSADVVRVVAVKAGQG